MTVTTQRHQQPQFAPPTHYQQATSHQNIQSRHASIMVLASLKASFAGGIGLLLLLVIGMIPPSEQFPIFSFAYLVLPGFPVVCLATGLLASLMAGDSIRNSNQGGKVGWMAGFWAGIYAAIGAMLISAAGFLMVQFGQNVAEQLAWLTAYGLTLETLALAGRVLGALIMFGVIGSLLCAMISSFGGMLYAKLGVTE